MNISLQGSKTVGIGVKHGIDTLVPIVAEPCERAMNKRQDSYLVKFVAAWLLSGVILGVVVGWVTAIGIGLVIAAGYIVADRSSSRVTRAAQMDSVDRAVARR